MKGKYSAQFNTSCGIRQGAPSLSLLFIMFINDLIDLIRARCVSEPLIEAIHVLLHADDTLILGTNRSLFVKKCNFMLEYFNNNKLKLNLGKSGYLFINGKESGEQIVINLSNGVLHYKHKIVYLGVIFSDTGKITNDIKDYVHERRTNITVKYSNFCARNFVALHSCVMTSLGYLHSNVMTFLDYLHSCYDIPWLSSFVCYDIPWLSSFVCLSLGYLHSCVMTLGYLHSCVMTSLGYLHSCVMTSLVIFIRVL